MYLHPHGKAEGNRPKQWLDYVVDFLEEVNDARLILELVLRAWDSERHDISQQGFDESLPFQERLTRLLCLPNNTGSPLEHIFHEIMITTDDNGSQRLSSLRNKSHQEGQKEQDRSAKPQAGLHHPSTSSPVPSP